MSRYKNNNYKFIEDTWKSSQKEDYEPRVTLSLPEWQQWVAEGKNTLYGGAIKPSGPLDSNIAGRGWVGGAVVPGHVRQGYSVPEIKFQNIQTILSNTQGGSTYDGFCNDFQKVRGCVNQTITRNNQKDINQCFCSSNYNSDNSPQSLGYSCSYEKDVCSPIASDIRYTWTSESLPKGVYVNLFPTKDLAAKNYPGHNLICFQFCSISQPFQGGIATSGTNKTYNVILWPTANGSYADFIKNNEKNVVEIACQADYFKTARYIQTTDNYQTDRKFSSPGKCS